MKVWNEPLTKNNMNSFIQEYSPMAYKAAYKILGDTTRSENVLIDSFVETFHYRSKDNGEGPLFIFGDILEKKVSEMSAKYPIPDSVQVSPRSLDEFTKATIISEVEKRISSLSFRVMDFLVFSDRSLQVSNRTSIVSRAIVSATSAGVNLLLIIQMIVVVFLLFIITYFGAMNIFGINEYIISNPFGEAQRNSLHIGEAIRYVPVDIIHQPEDSKVEASSVGDDNEYIDDNIYLTESLDDDESETSPPTSPETESTEPSLSATRG